MTDSVLDTPCDGCFAPVPVLEHELLQELQLGGLRFTESWHRASSTIDRHAHRWATVTVLLDGSFEESYAFRRDMNCEAPTVHIRPPGEPHRDRMGLGGAHNLVLEVDDERLELVRRHSSLLEEVRHLRSVEVLGVARRMQRELKVGDEVSGLALEGLAMELLATASRGARREERRPPPWLIRVHDLLQDRFRESGIRLDELAAEADVHPVHLARAFKAAYGSSPGEMLRRLRLEWAAQALESSSLTLAEIAGDAGFSDQSHFSRVFKAAFGMPPGAWRRERRGRGNRRASGGSR